ncbi:uncharacterized protein Triagg1_1293 [Trichoderma aggressivum f. europaeum]|uniref:Myb-like domain-containing protein n=1 Tax=Trichoderma aggressivum f. europaeum TaxID=173218 RepID=A0AAE1M2Y2_9HYPO|nr:hypothetical protein Triagg1_1293 [Trichoderma aggressivum f. europaeum]
MDNQAAGSDAAGIPAAGNEAFPGGQSFDAAVPGFDNGDGTGPLYHHSFDLNCEGCRRQAYVRLQEEQYLAAPQQWESMDANAQFYELRRLTMTEEEYFQSLSDFEDVNYFNQPYLAQFEEHGEQGPMYHHQQPFAPLLPVTEETQPVFGMQNIPDEVIEPLLFQQMATGEAFVPTTFQPTASEPMTVQPGAYGPATMQPTMYAPTFVPSGVEAPSFEPAEFNFNTLPHGPVQQPIQGEPWAMTHDGGLFEPTSEDGVEREASGEERNVLFSSAAQQMTEATTGVMSMQNPVQYEPLVPGQASVRPPRRLLPSNGQREPPVHRQPEGRARRLPAVQLTSEESLERAEKDLFLIESRRQNISYKDIKRLGNFAEAESTLRGRYRTLTKEKKDRVRDPKWTDIDVDLLKEAVRVLAHGLHPDRAKLSWMAVSRYITNHGGSYEFGFSTCHRRWVQLEEDGQLGDTGYDDSWRDEDEEAETLADPEEERSELEEDEEDEDSLMVDEDDQESEEEEKEDVVEENENESSSDNDDEDAGVPIKTEVKTEE